VAAEQAGGGEPGVGSRRGALTRYALGLFALLAVVWLSWSWHFEPLLLAFGAGSVALVVAIAVRMDVVDEESQPYALGFRPLAYLPWLLLEIAKANFAVARIIVSPRLPISPRLVRVRASQRGELARVVYANSITLTPGTISLDLREGSILVHALTGEAAAALEKGEMDRRVSRLEAAD